MPRPGVLNPNYVPELLGALKKIQILGPYSRPTEQSLEIHKLLKSSTIGYDAQLGLRTIHLDSSEIAGWNRETIVSDRASAGWEK